MDSTHPAHLARSAAIVHADIAVPNNERITTAAITPPRRNDRLVPFAREVIDVPVADELSESFLAYSMSVITSRAIPDVRDGLKPVQRRILHAMLQMGMRPDTPFRKSARVVGDTMGKYHPHGDGAIYDALVRLGQDFTRNVTLVDPQGNFGSSTTRPPRPATPSAASPAAMDMIGEIDEDTVDFRPTYDGEATEPVTLPGLLPNLLVNGTSGIAVGMATNMAPHNLGEVYEAIKLVMTKRRPKPTVDELMAVLPGPDFPSGGIVIDDGLRDAYETGRGSFRIRARAEVEQVGRRRQGIEVTELPYLVGPERVVAKIKELVHAGRLAGVSEVKNLSDRHHGLRIQIECKTGVNPQRGAHRALPAHPHGGDASASTTSCSSTACPHPRPLRPVPGTTSTTASTSSCAAPGSASARPATGSTSSRVAGRPRRHRRGRSHHPGSQDTAEARSRLIERFSLSEMQATHILDMPLRRLTALETLELEEEARRARADASPTRGRSSASEQRQRTIVLKELGELVERLGRPRRSTVMAPTTCPTSCRRAARCRSRSPTTRASSPVTTVGELSGASPPRGQAEPRPPRRARRHGRHHQPRPVFAITDTGRALGVTAMEVPEVAGRTRGAARPRWSTSSTASGSSPARPRRAPLRARHPAASPSASPATSSPPPARAPVIALKGDDRVVAAFPAPTAPTSSSWPTTPRRCAPGRPDQRAGPGAAGWPA
jgi:DNA gyrase subunit A